jgi:rubrerythrin
MCFSDVGEQAYKEAISDGGKGQTKLTEGWKVLGLSKETATRIFEEKKARGFLNFDEEIAWEEQDRIAREAAREAEFRQKMANAFDEEGNVINDDEDEEEVKDFGPGRKKECLSCGKVVEIFDDNPDDPWNNRNFVCPGCGGPKSNFKSILGNL